MGHGSWVIWVMGKLCDGSQKMTHFHLWWLGRRTCDREIASSTPGRCWVA